MEYENNANNTKSIASKPMFWMQIMANIVPILANIALAIMAFLQKSWMMLAMIVPSIMMYIACLIPQIVQYNSNKNNKSLVKNNTNQSVHFSKTTVDSHIKGVPETLVPINLEAMLINNANQIVSTNYSKNMQNRVPPWKNVCLLYTSDAADEQ